MGAFLCELKRLVNVVENGREKKRKEGERDTEDKGRKSGAFLSEQKEWITLVKIDRQTKEKEEKRGE